MLIVGELINTSRKIVKENVEQRNVQYIRNIARRQADAGAHYLDISCTDMSDEREAIGWLVENIQAVVNIPLCIDTPDPAAMKSGLSMVKNSQPMVNSLNGEEEHYRMILPLVLKYKTKVIALCMDDKGIPNTAEDRLQVAKRLIKGLTKSGIPFDDIYLDPLVKALSTGDIAGLEVLDSIKLIKKEFPDVHIISAISNISFGLPNRKMLNRLFLVQTMTTGMDAFIIDPLDEKLMGYLYASQALLGQDEFCKNYLSAHRRGIYEVQRFESTKR